MAHDDGDDRPAGFDTIAVERWMGRTLEPEGRLESPVRWQRLPGGHSNLTYRLSDDIRRRLVFRRAPLGPVLAKAPRHDAGVDRTHGTGRDRGAGAAGRGSADGGVDVGRLFDRMRASIELAAITAGVP